MKWGSFQIKESSFLSPALPPPTIAAAGGGDGGFLESRVSPSILLMIVILAIIFFISGLLHLLVRFLIRPPAARIPADEVESATVLQGPLQQLFHLHDAGVDQSFIDETLPVFLYKDVIITAGAADGKTAPYDCAVCLCEFELEDKLRLLPKCSHGFHMECIDTWLLSHSTCPLCRSSLLDFSGVETTCSPAVLVLESGSERESNGLGRSDSVLTACSLVGYHGDTELGSFRVESVSNRPGTERYALVFESQEQSFRRILPPESLASHPNTGFSSSSRFNLPGVLAEPVGSGHDRVVRVKLGKFRNVEGSGNGVSSSSNADVRRCQSMGSFEYVMDTNSSLQVPIRMAKKNPVCESAREFGGFKEDSIGLQKNVSIGHWIGKRESLSVSKIWMAEKKKKQRKEKQGSLEDAGDYCGELGSSSGSAVLDDSKTPSFARRTLLWLAGRQNKVVDSNWAPNV